MSSLPLAVSGNTLALVATLSGFIVGLAGVVSNVLIAWFRRGQDLALAEKQHEHERELARGTRLYDRRAPVYERMMAIVQPGMEHVEARNKVVRFSVEPPLPPEPELEDQRALQIELRTHGSKEVGDAFHDFVQKVFAFQLTATTYETSRDQGGRGDLSGEGQAMEDARKEAREAADKLQRLVADELASF